VVVLTLLLMLFYLFRNALLSFATWAQERTVRASVTDVASRLLLEYFSAPYAFHFHRHSAGLIQRVAQSVEVAYTLVLSASVHILTEAVIAAAIVTVLAVAAPLATLVTTAATALLILVSVRLTGRTFERLGRDEQRYEEALLAQLQHSLGAMKEVKIAGRERYFYDRFAATRAALSRVQARRETLQDVTRLGVETVFVCAMLLVVLLLTLRGRPSQEVVSLLGLYAYAGFRLVPSANRISRFAGQITVGRPYLQDVAEDFASIAAWREARGDGAPAAAAEAPSGEPARFREAIRFEAVSYAYDTSADPVLEHVTLTIRKGESVGLVGHTGAGKSTLVDLLLGLLQPTHGRITVDGRDLRTHARWWQQQIGYVPQAFYIVDDTLRRNIAFGVPDHEIDARRVAEVVRVAQLDEVVARLPAGLDTVVGERGIRLSGGERQRVVIARALYRDPAVLVFDEATSALDVQTERELVRAIDALRGAVTLVVIAHRLATVRRCDRLVFLERGRVVAVGSYEALLAECPAFRAFAAER
jgi:ABC-type multidrug transport system fused ATPase/permease subunit